MRFNLNDGGKNQEGLASENNIFEDPFKETSDRVFNDPFEQENFEGKVAPRERMKEIQEDPARALDMLCYSSKDLLPDDADIKTIAELSKLREEVSDGVANNTEIPPTCSLFPEYKKMMEDGRFDSVEQLCNRLCLNYDDVYDYDPKWYGDEFRRGFKEYLEQGGTGTFTFDDFGENESDAYRYGADCAARLIDLIYS